MPPGPQRPNNNGAVIVILAVVVLLIGGGAVLRWGFGVGAPRSRPVVAVPTLPDIPTPPGYTPLPLPTITQDSPTGGYSPPPLHYGAIAVARDGSIGKSWDYSTRAAAERRALNSCPRSNCKVLVVFVNACGAVAYNAGTNRYWGGNGATRAAAQRDAVSRAGGGRWITWVCTTR